MSLLDKIRQESASPTVKVKPKDDTLIQQAAASLTEEQTVTSPEQIQQTDPIADLEAKLATYPVVSSKKVGVRLEESVLGEIQTLCRQNGITIETLLEGYYTVCKDKESTMRRVIKEAQTRAQKRTEAGNIRSLITKSRNLQKRNRS